MKRLAVVLIAVLALGPMACKPQPTPTITATPSTLAPGCDTITTVTGKALPAGSVKAVQLEIQQGSKWIAYKWFPTGVSGETWQVISAEPSKTTGAYSLTYYRPHLSVVTQRLRIRGWARSSTEVGFVSKSWYVTNACRTA